MKIDTIKKCHDELRCIPHVFTQPKCIIQCHQEEMENAITPKFDCNICPFFYFMSILCDTARSNKTY